MQPSYKAPTFSIKSLSFLLALIHEPPQVAKLDFPEFHSSLQVTHISQRSEKTLTEDLKPQNQTSRKPGC